MCYLRRGLRPSPIMKYGSSGKTTQVNRKRTLSSERQVTRHNYRTPSPRFDPTAYLLFTSTIHTNVTSLTWFSYIQEKVRQQEEIDQRLGYVGDMYNVII